MSEWIEKNREYSGVTGNFIAKKTVFHLLSKIKNVGLRWRDEDGKTHFFGDQFAALQGDCRVNQASFYQRLIKGGSVGAGEGYILGEWESSDLSQLLRVLATQLPMLDALERKLSWITKIERTIRHLKTKNRLKQSQQNIMAHYDIGNAFYETFLDDQWLYSSGIYQDENTTLAAAQQAKMARLCQKLALTANDHVLEIGSGWGAMAIFMAKEYGCKVTTTTISPAQYAFTKTQIERHQLTEQITLLQQDYRQLTGQFDKVVSIEMIEAVGEAYLTGFIKICQARLKPKGLLALQCITIADPRYHTYSQRLDFIQTHIFPGGFLPSISVLVAKSQQHTQFVLKDVKDIGLDYARTLQDWRQRFESHLSVYPSMGLDPYFIRMWRFYFCYCEAGFLTENVSAVQLLFSRQD